ncbi:MAG: TRAP transporter small permease subunit [Succinivibrio sp.]|nr:TRAP transporter small permease subunit [Succinivibrio sp.]
MQSKILLIKRLLEWVLSRAAALLLISMTALVIIQVVSRYLFQSPTAFTEEIVRYTLIWTGFIGAAYAFSTRQHMALIFFRDKLSGNSHMPLWSSLIC